MPKQVNSGVNSKRSVKTHSHQIEHDLASSSRRSGLDPVHNYRQAGRAIGGVIAAVLRERRPGHKLIYSAILFVLVLCALGPTILTRLFPLSQQQLLTIEAANSSSHADWQFLSSLGVGFLPFVQVNASCGECYRNKDRIDVLVLGRIDRPAYFSDTCTDMQGYMQNPTSRKWDVVRLTPWNGPLPIYKFASNQPEETLLFDCHFDPSTLKAPGMLRLAIFGYSNDAKSGDSKGAAYEDVQIK